MLSSDLVSAAPNTRLLYRTKCTTKPYSRGCFGVDVDSWPEFTHYFLRLGLT